jgi:GDP-mannose transporter
LEINLHLLHSFNHLITAGDLNFLLVVFQAVIAVVAVSFSKMMGWVDYPSFNMKVAMQWAPVNIAFCAMLFTGMASLQYNSVPMVTIFKNITNIVVSAGDLYFFGTKVESLVMVAFGVMLGGAVFAAKNDMTVTVHGLFWMVANCLATAGYILYMKFATKNVKLSKFGMVFYNNVLCTVFMLPVTLYNGEMKVFMASEKIHTFDYAWRNGFAGFVGFFLNFASLNCVSYTGPTTYAIVGSLNKVPVAILGWIIFDSKISPQTWFFIAVSMCGGFLYSYAKITAGKKKKARVG